MSEETVITAMGDLVGGEVDNFKMQILEKIAENPEKIVVDLSKVRVIDSSGIGMLVATRNSASSIDCRLTVRGISANILKMFKIMRLTDYFEFED